MKWFKTTAFLFAAFLGFALAVANPIKAEAQSHLVYYDKDDDDHEHDDGWFYIYGISDVGQRESHQEAREDLYYLSTRFNSGDNLAIDGYGNDPSRIVTVDLRGKTINELAVKNATGVIVYADHINNVNILFESSASIHADVDNATVYNSSSAEFYNNVGNMHISSERDEYLLANVHVQGTVGYFDGTNKYSLFYSGSNVAKNQFSIKAGSVVTDEIYYTSGGSPVAGVASSQTVAAPAPAAAPAAPSGGTKSPKTGESALPLTIFLLSLAGFTFSLCKRKTFL